MKSQDVGNAGELRTVAREYPKGLERKLRFVHSVSDLLCNQLSLPGGRAVAELLAHVVLPPLTESLRCPTVLGFELVVSPLDGNNYYRHGYYEMGTLHVIKSVLKPGDVFVDVGASVGQMSFCASQAVGVDGRVLSFEPHPGRFKSLQEGVQINRANNLSIHNIALGQSEANSKLFTDRVSPSLVPNGTGDGINVPILPLDSVLQSEGVDHVNMMKIDVEGFELQVLKGATKQLSSPNAPFICIEHEAHGGAPLAPLEFLRDINNYSFFRLQGSKTRASRLVPVEIAKARLGDNVFCLLPQHRRVASNLF